MLHNFIWVLWITNFQQLEAESFFSGALSKFTSVAAPTSVGAATKNPVEVAPKITFLETPDSQPQEILNPFYNQVVPETFGLASAKKEILTGSTLPMSGAVSLVGVDIASGMDLVFNQLNQNGGIQGNLIKIKNMDSENEVMLAEKNLRTLSQATPFFLNVFGSETVASVLELIKTQKILMLFPLAGDSLFRKHDLRYCIHFRASVADEIAALVTYSITKLYRDKVGILYEDSRWGEEGLRQAEATLARFDKKSLVSASYPENTVEITSAINKIADKNPNVVLCISHARPTYNFIIQALKKGLKSAKFLGLGEVVPIQEILEKSRGIQLITSSVVPSPFKSELPIVAKYRKEMAQFYANKSMSQFFLESYCATNLLVQCFKQIPPPFSIASVLGWLEKIKNFDLGGLNLSFDPSTRALCSDVWINLGNTKPWPVFKKTTV